MPKLSPGQFPSYRIHKASQRAIVTLNGHDFALGKPFSPESYREYDRMIVAWVERGRQPPRPASESGPSVQEIVAAYRVHCERYYRRGGPKGEPTSALQAVRIVLEAVEGECRELAAGEFGPKRYKAIRQRWVAAGLCRDTINSYAAWIKRMFRWAVGEELISVGLYEALRAVPGLYKGRGEAPDYPAVQPVPEAAFLATLAMLKPVWATMAQVQLLASMRPGEVVGMSGGEIDQSESVWVYWPAAFKGDFRDLNPAEHRWIVLGPRCQELLRPWLERFPSGPLFRPASATGKAAGYSRQAYYRAIQGACRRAGVECWHPHRLRHSGGTLIRKLYGAEGAQAVLGHASLDTTELYAGKDLALARRIASEIG